MVEDLARAHGHVHSSVVETVCAVIVLSNFLNPEGLIVVFTVSQIPDFFVRLDVVQNYI